MVPVQPRPAPALPGPFLSFRPGLRTPLPRSVTVVGRGPGVDLRVRDRSVSRVHAELIRRGPFLYVCDAGLSRNGTFVNGQRVTSRLLGDGDVVAFGTLRARVGGTGEPAEVAPDPTVLPSLTARELEVLTVLCRPAMSGEPFVAPASAREICAELFVTEAAVKQHLFRLYEKFSIPDDDNRRTALANLVVRTGLLHRRLCLAVYGAAA